MTTHTDPSTRLTSAGIVNVLGLVVFGALIMVQIAGGMDNYPTIPPGLVLSVLVVGLVVLGARWRWTTLVGLGWPVMLTVGAFLSSGSLAMLAGDGGTFVQVTSILQRAGLLVALVAGVIAVVEAYRPGRRAA